MEANMQIPNWNIKNKIQNEINHEKASWELKGHKK